MSRREIKMTERRKHDRRKDKRRFGKLDHIIQKGIANGIFHEMRQSPRRKSDRRKIEQLPLYF